jgi:hypothetical protein
LYLKLVVNDYARNPYTSESHIPKGIRRYLQVFNSMALPEVFKVGVTFDTSEMTSHFLAEIFENVTFPRLKRLELRKFREAPNRLSGFLLGPRQYIA